MNPVEHKLRRWQLAGLSAGLAGTAASVAAYLTAPDDFFRGYLVGYLFWWRLTIGFVALALLRCIIRSHWGNATWPYLRAGLGTLPVVALLAVPIGLGIEVIFPWAGGGHHASESDHAASNHVPSKEAEAAATTHGGASSGRATLSRPVADVDGHEPGDDAASSHHNPFQDWYLEPNFFLGRGVVYFAIWMLCGVVAARTGTSTGDARWPRRIASFAMMALVLATTFAAFDWGMSLEPEWYSTIYGAMILVSGVVAALAVLILALVHVFRTPRSVEVGFGAIVNDLGNLLLAFLMIWAYFAFSQFLIIWSGNLPSEVTWYLRRSVSSWQAVLLVVVAFHFVGPFLLLLSREQKRRPRRLARVAGLLLAANLVENLWTIAPSFSATAGDLHWSLPFAVVGMGGWWTLGFAAALQRSLKHEQLLERAAG